MARALQLPTIGGFTSIPFDPRSAPSPAPARCPAECCQSNPECRHRRQSDNPGYPLRGLLPEPGSRFSSDGIHSWTLENPPRRSARSPTSPPSAPLDPAPPVSPTAAASPGKGDIGLPVAPLQSPAKTPPALVDRLPGSSRHRSPPWLTLLGTHP